MAKQQKTSNHMVHVSMLSQVGFTARCGHLFGASAVSLGGEDQRPQRASRLPRFRALWRSPNGP